MMPACAELLPLQLTHPGDIVPSPERAGRQNGMRRRGEKSPCPAPVTAKRPVRVIGTPATPTEPISRRSKPRKCGNRLDGEGNRGGLRQAAR